MADLISGVLNVEELAISDGLIVSFLAVICPCPAMAKQYGCIAMGSSGAYYVRGERPHDGIMSQQSYEAIPRISKAVHSRIRLKS